MAEFNLGYISDRRKALSLTCQDMADAMGFKTASVYWKYEKGVYKFNADMLPLLARALRTKVKNFYS